MKKLMIFAVLLASQTVLSGMALAQGCSTKTKMSCAEGSVWDDESRQCSPKPSA